MTTVQVYEGEGPTPDILPDEITDLILKAHPEVFPPDYKAYVKRRAVYFVNTIIEQKDKLNRAMDYLDNAATDEVVDPDPEPTLEDTRRKLDDVTKRLIVLDHENVEMGEKLKRIEGELGD